MYNLYDMGMQITIYWIFDVINLNEMCFHADEKRTVIMLHILDQWGEYNIGQQMSEDMAIKKVHNHLTTDFAGLLTCEVSG